MIIKKRRGSGILGKSNSIYKDRKLRKKYGVFWEIRFGSSSGSAVTVAETKVGVKCYTASWTMPSMPELPLINSEGVTAFCQKGKWCNKICFTEIRHHSFGNMK